MHFSNISNLKHQPSSPRVLHVLEATLGGTMRYLHNVLAACADLPFESGFAYAEARADHQLPPFLTAAEDAGWKLFPITASRAVSPLGDARAISQTVRAIRSFRPDIIHCHSSKAGALGRLASLSLWPRPKLIYSPHALAVSSGLYLAIERSLGRLTNKFLAVSDSERDQILNLRIGNSDSVGVLYPTIDTEHFAPIPQARARQQLQRPDRPTVVGVGRLTGQKDPLHFLKIIAGVRESLPNVSGIWVGDGELAPAFRTELQRLQLEDHVHLTGWQSDPRPFIAASDLLLSTSRFESFGYMAAEALSMAVPVVASQVCGTVDILTGALSENLYSPDNTADAVQKLQLLLTDSPRARAIGAAGRSAIQSRFSVEKLRSQLSEHYTSLLATNSRQEAHRARFV